MKAQVQIPSTDIESQAGQCAPAIAAQETGRFPGFADQPTSPEKRTDLRFGEIPCLGRLWQMVIEQGTQCPTPNTHRYTHACTCTHTCISPTHIGNISVALFYKIFAGSTFFLNNFLDVSHLVFHVSSFFNSCNLHVVISWSVSLIFLLLCFLPFVYFIVSKHVFLSPRVISGILLNPSSIFEAGALSQTQSLSAWLLWIACPKDALFQHPSVRSWNQCKQPTTPAWHLCGL